MYENLLSIVIPVYNGERYLKETLESIRKSSYEDFEVILIDDGSRDRSLDICRRFCKIDSRFQCIKQENKGIAEARNEGMMKAKGNFICFCDQDDYVAGDFYMTVINRIKLDGSDMGICSAKKFYDIDNIGKGSYFEYHEDNVISDKKEICHSLIMPELLWAFYEKNFSNPHVRGTIWNCIMRKELLENNNLKFEKYVSFEDDSMMRLDLLLHASKVSTLKYCGYYWRTNILSESHTSKFVMDLPQKQLKKRAVVEKKLKKHFFETEAELYVKYARCYDLIKIVENERGRKYNFFKRSKYLRYICDPLNTASIKKCSQSIRKGEIRYIAIWFCLKKNNYGMAYMTDKFFFFLITNLNRIKVGNYVDDIIKLRNCGLNNR